MKIIGPLIVCGIIIAILFAVAENPNLEQNFLKLIGYSWAGLVILMCLVPLVLVVFPACIMLYFVSPWPIIVSIPLFLWVLQNDWTPLLKCFGIAGVIIIVGAFFGSGWRGGGI